MPVSKEALRTYLANLPSDQQPTITTLEGSRPMTPEEREAWLDQSVEDQYAIDVADEDAAAVEAAAELRRRSFRTRRARLEENVTKLRANAVKLKDKAAFDAMTAVAKADALRLANIDSTESAADVTAAFLALIDVLQDQGIFKPTDDQPPSP